MLGKLIWVDYFILAVMVLSLLTGLLRGFLKEAISLAAWIGAFIVAFWFVDEGTAYLERYIGIPPVSIVLAFSGLFLCMLILGGLINLIIAQLIPYTKPSGADRMLGVLLGLLRGSAFIAVLVLLAGLTPLPQNPWWQQSPLLPHFQPPALWLRSFLPPELAQYFKFP